MEAMSNKALKYNREDCGRATGFLKWGLTTGRVRDIVCIASCVLNGEWEYAPKQMSYQGYSSQERMCEVEAMKGEWDASGQSV